jgi:putative acetyltransferase
VKQSLQILAATQPEQVKQVRELVVEYVKSLGIDLSFQDFERELQEFPGEYAPPMGRLFLATDEEGPAGCIGLRELEPGICEMKRLYVRERCRGQGLGQRLVQVLIQEARAMGYTAMRLDTLPNMHAAIGMYRALGFKPTAPYYRNPIEGALFFELKL